MPTGQFIHTKRPLEERFWEKVDVRGPDECWPWTRKHNPKGYGQFRKDKMVQAHRMAWELTNGPIPDGLDVLHTCDNPPCCNPHHLFLGTNDDNMRDMNSKGRHGNIKKTHCPYNHPYSGDNLYVAPNGKRQCIMCRRSNDRRRVRPTVRQ